MALKSLTGFRDFFPEDCRERDYLFGVWRASAERFGFSPYDGPPLESLELYTRKSGDEIVSQLYCFEDKGERQVSLRPEMTPTLARMVGKAHRQYRKPLKWFSIPQLFRYERPQKGRLREHYQWNCDIVGEAGVEADVELIGLLISAMRDLGFGPRDIRVRISDRSIWNQFFEDHGVEGEVQTGFLQALDKLEKVGEEKTREQLGDLADAVFELIASGRGSERTAKLLQKARDLGFGDYLELDLSIVRGLAYYSGLVFEVHERSGASRAIAGGGRYDGLVKLISGEDMPAIGFGMGDVVISDLLRERDLFPKEEAQLDYFVVVPDAAHRLLAEQTVFELRAKGYRVDYLLGEAKVAKQFQAAEERKSERALIVDAQTADSGLVSVKNLTTRQQEDCKLADFPAKGAKD